MSAATTPPEAGVRYEPDERPPLGISIGLGFQATLLLLGFFVFIPTAVVRAAGLEEAYLSWAVFAALISGGLSTILQAVRCGRFGAGRLQVMATAPAYIAISLAALRAGGPPLLATLVLAASVCQVFAAFRLSWMHRILTPTIAGMVTMLVAVAMMPVIVPMLNDVPAGAAPAAAPLSFGVALAVIVGLVLRGSASLRLWAPMLGVVVGSLVAGVLGVHDLALIGGAAWLGLPQLGWPGFDLSFGPEFWGFLPVFVFVAMIEVVKVSGDSIAVQRVSLRTPRSPDYRVVQGTTAGVGAANLACAALGTLPSTTAAIGAAVIELTGVSARRVGVWTGILLLVAAFVPKMTAIYAAIPAPVVGAYLFALCALLFVVGMRVVVHDGMNIQKATIVGVAFWLGAGFERGDLFPAAIGSGFQGALLGSGLAIGGLVAILLTVLLDLVGSRPRRLMAPMNSAVGPKTVEFLTGLATARGWEERGINRLVSAAEEALLTLSEAENQDGTGAPRQLRLTARADRRQAELEFVTASGDENFQDRIALLGERPTEAIESEVSLRLLRHYASSVRHRKYHDADIVTVHVDASR